MHYIHVIASPMNVFSDKKSLLRFETPLNMAFNKESALAGLGLHLVNYVLLGHER